MEKKSFIKACREHFGYREGTGLKEFSIELKELTEKDRAEMKVMFEAIDIEIEEKPTFSPASA